MSTDIWIALFAFGVFVAAAGTTYAAEAYADRKRSKAREACLVQCERRTEIFCRCDCVHKDIAALGFHCDRPRVLIDGDGKCMQYVPRDKQQKGAL